VALSWTTSPDTVDYPDLPSADIDLSIVKPNGQYLSVPWTWDSTLEMVEFIAPDTGNYQVFYVPYRMKKKVRFGVAASITEAQYISNREPSTAVEPRAVTKPDHNSVSHICVTCHNESTMVTEPHWSTSQSCAACHKTTTWSDISTFDHNEVRATCDACHAFPASHAGSRTTSCYQCHTTTTWTPF